MDSHTFGRIVSLWPQQRAGVQEPALKQLWSLSWPWPSPAHSSPARPGFSVGRIAVSLVRQPGALGRWQGVRASGRGPLKSHLRGATPTRPLRWRLFWASPEAARLPFLEQQQSRPHAVASGKWGEGRFLLYFQSKLHGLCEDFCTCAQSEWRYCLFSRWNWQKFPSASWLKLCPSFCSLTGHFSFRSNKTPNANTLICLFYLCGLAFLPIIENRWTENIKVSSKMLWNMLSLVYTVMHSLSVFQESVWVKHWVV